MKEKSNVEKFQEWLEKMKNIHLGDNVRMERAYQIIKP